MREATVALREEAVAFQEAGVALREEGDAPVRLKAQPAERVDYVR